MALLGNQGMKMVISVFSDKEVIDDFSENTFNGVVELKVKL